MMLLVVGKSIEELNLAAVVHTLGTSIKYLQVTLIPWEYKPVGSDTNFVSLFRS